jgi:hypothetical protein
MPCKHLDHGFRHFLLPAQHGARFRGVDVFQRQPQRLLNVRGRATD